MIRTCSLEVGGLLGGHELDGDCTVHAWLVHLASSGFKRGVWCVWCRFLGRDFLARVHYLGIFINGIGARHIIEYYGPLA